MFDYACHEENIGMEGILAGARTMRNPPRPRSRSPRAFLLSAVTRENYLRRVRCTAPGAR
jgi:hypothetical protein